MSKPKTCDKCGKEVKETIHTQAGWTIGYLESHRNGETTCVCVACIAKEKRP